MITKFFDFALSPVDDVSEKLYYRSDGFSLVKGSLMAAKKDSVISFDTYLNFVPVKKLLEYTSAEKIIFRVNGKNIKTNIYAQCENEDFFLAESTNIDMEEIPENAVSVYPVITATDNNAVVDRISVYIEGARRKFFAALIICTYKREEYVIPNVDYISKEISHKELPIQIIVVDNARTLDKSVLSQNVILISNENTGGSGGFGIGMKVASEMKKFTHFILMDDDVKLDSVSLQKMLGFLSVTDEKYEDICISGSMLYINDSVRQFESGGYFSPDGEQKGYGHYLDMTEKTCLYTNELEKRINYGGWWFMCIPMRYADEGNYPMPFFIKYDDVEYSLRCGLNIITLNGVSVWHEPFEWKYNSSSEYYNIRNYLYLRSITDRNFSKRKARKIARKQYFEKLCRQQYKMAQAVKFGYIDFLKGVDYLYKIDQEENHKRICGLNYEMLSEEELFKRYGIRVSQEKLEASYKAIFKWYMKPLMYGLLVPKFLCKKEYAVVDAFFDRKEMYWRTTKTIHFCFPSNRGYITTKQMSMKK